MNAKPLPNPYQLSTEQALPSLYQQTLPDFWTTHAIEGVFAGKEGIAIRYAVLRQPRIERVILIINGRAESYLKYQELAWDLWHQGYSLYLIDHRGQGLSGRLLDDPEQGYVEQFDDYVQDFKQFYDDIVRPDQPTKVFLLAHSMGAAIAIRYLARWPAGITAAALCSPMLGINLGGLPKWFAKGLTAVMAKLGRWLGRPPYGPGQGRYQAHPFPNNGLTHSQVRYHAFQRLCEQHPQIKLGGATAHWISQGISGADGAMADAASLTTPLLILQAGEESVVDNRAQDQFCRCAPCAGGKPLRIAGSWHEPLMEADPQRLAALNATLAFFERF
ncbi:alpha/beta fold hydrolase [Aeromonas cavernicola]|uniref:Lysophospholipase n=1 Tax=Aeromonas cavernicola TaxID=1006623 RepID=A0A2H9U3Y7_9GAMM|nr:alpha/beta fold hydrolase [Aeromonas cavernicola]PJG58745.1 lysophospholipase [Aeromonas cavernicola]